MTQITPTVDFEKEGKQVGWLRLPHSVTRSAYGVLTIPVAVIKNGSGPQILVTAGNHGDEYEGQVVLTRMIQDLKPEEIKETDPIFGEGLGLDSLDAVELVLLLQKHYKIEIKDMEEAKKAFASIQALADYIRVHQSQS